MYDNLTKRSHGLGLLLAAWAVAGCSSFNEAYESRVCWDAPGQCKSATLDFVCGETIEVKRADRPATPIAIVLTRDAETREIGELFSQSRPIPIYVDNGSPYRTLERDVRDIIGRAGYTLTDPQESGKIMKLDLISADVRSDDPGWISLTIPTRSAVLFTITRDGNRRTFTGTANIRHAYAAIGDYQEVLSKAYCESLSEFARSVEAGVLDEL